jgi:hypothetical protein
MKCEILFVRQYDDTCAFGLQIYEKIEDEKYLEFTGTFDYKHIVYGQKQHQERIIQFEASNITLDFGLVGYAIYSKFNQLIDEAVDEICNTKLN